MSIIRKYKKSEFSTFLAKTFQLVDKDFVLLKNSGVTLGCMGIITNYPNKVRIHQLQHLYNIQ